MTSLYEGVSKEQNNIYVLDYIKNRDFRFYDLNGDEPRVKTVARLVTLHTNKIYLDFYFRLETYCSKRLL